MPSRWTDSGIDWNNIGDYRTEWVIDELYLAFKEKEALLNYYRRVNGGSYHTVQTWDLRYPKRCREKIEEIMITLKEWLRFDELQIKSDLQAGAENVYYFWMPSNAPASMPTDLFKPLTGLPYYNCEANGDFETVLGESLQRLRDFPQSLRIDRDLISLLRNILINLKKCYLAYVRANVFGFNGELFYDSVSYKVGERQSELIGEDYGTSEQDHTNAYNNYVALASPSDTLDNKNSSATGFVIISNKRNSSTGNMEVGHTDVHLHDNFSPPSSAGAGGGILSSKNIRRTFSDSDFGLFRYYNKDNEDSYSGFTYDTLTKIMHSGNTCEVSELNHPLPLSAFPWDDVPGRPAYANVTVKYIGFIDLSKPNISEYNNS